jgi:hypothetical protein
VLVVLRKQPGLLLFARKQEEDDRGAHQDAAMPAAYAQSAPSSNEIANGSTARFQQDRQRSRHRRMTVGLATPDHLKAIRPKSRQLPRPPYEHRGVNLGNS